VALLAESQSEEVLLVGTQAMWAEAKDDSLSSLEVVWRELRRRLR
jgi:hypothetical protein